MPRRTRSQRARSRSRVRREAEALAAQQLQEEEQRRIAEAEREPVWEENIDKILAQIKETEDKKYKKDENVRALIVQLAEATAPKLQQKLRLQIDRGIEVIAALDIKLEELRTEINKIQHIGGARRRTYRRRRNNRKTVRR